MLTVLVVISGGGVDDDGLDRLDVMVLMMVQWTVWLYYGRGRRFNGVSLGTDH